MIAIFWRDFPTFTTPLPFDALNEGIPSSCRVHIWYGETGMDGLQSGEGRTVMDPVVWAQYINVANRQPRRRSNRRAFLFGCRRRQATSEAAVRRRSQSLERTCRISRHVAVEEGRRRSALGRRGLDRHRLQFCAIELRRQLTVSFD